MPTLVRLRQSPGGENRTGGGGDDPLRESRVHFDQHVAVHHLSPPTDGNSPDGSPRTSSSPDSIDNDDYASRYSNELSTSYLGYDDYETTPKAGVLRDRSGSGMYGELKELDSTLSSYGFFPPSPNTDATCKKHSLSDHVVRSISGDIAALDNSNMSDSNEPISVVASDLRRFTVDSSGPSKSKKLFHNNESTLKSRSVPVISDRTPALPMNVYRSLPVVVQRSGVPERSPPYRPLKDFDFANSAGDGAEAPSVDSEEGIQNALSRPELNSTLRVGRDLAKMKGKGFDVTESMRVRVNARTKLMIDEKVLWVLYV